MDRILPARRDWPLHGVAASREIEQRSQAGLPPHTLMRRAGHAVAALTRALYPHAHRVWIACGPGNNGGDGFDAALHLLEAGCLVEVAFAGDPTRLPVDAADALARARAAGLHITSQRSPSTPPDVAIDALLGLGGNRPPSGRVAELIQALNALACPVIAVDVPSGLDSDTGQAHGADCVVARHTLSLLTLKPGLFTGRGRDHAGEVWLDMLGIAPQDETASASLAGAAALNGPRRHADHKGSFGDVAVVGGDSGMVGAALLAARAAHAAGAGRVYVDVLAGDHRDTLDAQRPELMFRPEWSHEAPTEALQVTTVVAGCGGGAAIARTLPRLLSTAGRLVLDADALNAIAADAALVQLLIARRGRQRESILTPHPLEAARLLGTTTANVQADRINAAKQLAARLGSVVVLKGSGTVIASPDGTVRINGTGNASLASAGTGDVLAGWIAGSWSASRCDAEAAARHATWLHGLAAEQAGVTPLRAGDLIDLMQRAATPR